MPTLRAITPLLSAALLIGCSAQAQERGPLKAVAELHDVRGRLVGTVVLIPTATPGLATNQGLWITAHFFDDGLPGGVRGFHIHDKGACSPSFDAAGPHFDPAGHEHGALSPKGRHAGDLPNLHLPKRGEHVVEIFAHGLSLSKEDAGSVLDADGSAFIVHEKPDDYSSQPTGDAGGRIACGVIKPAG